MKKLVWLAAALISSAAVAAEQPWPQQDGDVTVVWQKPSEYRDVKAASGIQSRYQNHVFASLGKHMQKKITPKLQAGSTMVITVTNLDLAGDVRPTFGATANDIRVVKSVYPPKMDFTYQLKDGNGKVVEQQQVKLNDLGFDSRSSLRYSNQALHFEMTMIDGWVNRKLVPSLANR
ncbi:DUF3016 domain-containing protein [uncultured Ferrimonas sp.]|uniref:DUF3016 domain-containing protein n=1 Tax=uncultured Ferrimonas sp. TaxID=432640 RepID=UPI00262851D8|nr:DUF3016 domain-containing protein [uncultured Ferrimonas sp.]